MSRKQKEQSGAARKRVDLAKLFKVQKSKEGFKASEVGDLFNYDKKLPAGEGFLARFAPVQPWKKGLQGFSIFGFERTIQVNRKGEQLLTRAQTIQLVKQLLKPGDIDLEDVEVYHADKFDASKLEQAKKAEQDGDDQDGADQD